MLVVPAVHEAVVFEVAVKVATGGTVAVIVLDLFAIHPLASVILTEYVPGTKPVKS